MSMSVFIMAAAVSGHLTLFYWNVLMFYFLQFHDLHHRMEDRDIEKTFGVDSREKGDELTAQLYS